MITELNRMEIDCISGGRIDDPGKNNDQVYKEVDWWKRNNPNRYSHHWEAQYTYDSNWNITDVTVVEVQDDYYA